jgi:hypothetical protein
MHIVQVIDAVLPVRKYGGTERVVQSLGRALAEAGHEVTLLAREGTHSRAAQVSSSATRRSPWTSSCRETSTSCISMAKCIKRRFLTW